MNFQRNPGPWVVWMWFFYI